MNCQHLSLLAPNFLDLQYFEHKKLFVNNSPIFEALDLLEGYLHSFRFEILSPFDGVFLENRDQIYIGKGCKIAPFVHIEGPCIIGNGCEIRPGAFIRKGSVIGDNCTIGHGTEISRSIVLNGSKFAHFNYLGDSVVGNRVNFGAGSICANQRLDKKGVAIRYEGGKIPTGRNKLGAIIGDGAMIGCNAVLNPGTVLFPDVMIEPLKVVKGVIKWPC